MTDPCQFQKIIIQHGSDIARQGEAITNMSTDIKEIKEMVSVLVEKMQGMKGFVSGAGAVIALIIGAFAFAIKMIAGIKS